MHICWWMNMASQLLQGGLWGPPEVKDIVCMCLQLDRTMRSPNLMSCRKFNRSCFY